jgi:copper chaperone
MTKYSVPEMSCGHCTAAIERQIKSADSAATVACDLGDRTVAVTTTLAADALLAAFREAGYEATPV